jgi:hypothetical protein
MLRMTAQEMKDAGACYELNQIQELWGDRESLSALDILDLDIPDADKLWGVLRLELLTEPQFCECLARIVEYTMDNERTQGRTPDERSVIVPEKIRAYSRGEITSEEMLSAARAAARAADAAAYAAAYAAYAARAAAYAARAAYAAADAAAYVAARAADAAAYADIVQIVRDVLGDVADCPRERTNQ